MAKRKRLSAPNPDLVAKAQQGQQEGTDMRIEISTGQVPQTRRAPIADVAGAAATTAALEMLSREMTAAKREGRLIQSIPLDQVNASYLIRDRMVLDAGEMDVLKASLKARGQQTPIEVVDLGTEGYGLISGFRRLTALRELAHEGGVGHVQALVRSPEDASGAYTAMVEENEIRVGLSYFERANIVRRAVENGIFPNEKKALQTLFASASRAKRSKIKSFLPLVDALGAQLQFPNAIGERLGLQLSAALEETPLLGTEIEEALKAQDAATSETEQALLQGFLTLKNDTLKEASQEKNVAMQDVLEPKPLTLTRHKTHIKISGDPLDDHLVAALQEFLDSWSS